MKKIALALAASAAACAPSAAPSTTSSSAAQAIINGESCSADVEPTAVAIMLDATMNFGQGPQDITAVMCTGTLIAPDVVIVAAHCTDPTLLTFGFDVFERADFYISFEPDLSAYSQENQQPPPLPESAIPVRELVAHPDFDINSLGLGTDGGPEADIALLFLEIAIDVNDVRPEIVIGADEVDELNVGDDVTIAGWGQQQNNGGAAGVKKCGATTLDELGTGLMQVGADPDKVRKCHGDSGGPTYIEIDTDTDIKRRVIGVTSRAYDGQQACNVGGVDTRIDFYLDWLDDEMSLRCDNSSRAFCDVPGLVPADFKYDGEKPNNNNNGNEGEGEDEDDVPDNVDPSSAPFGCASAPAAPLFFALLALSRRRRR